MIDYSENAWAAIEAAKEAAAASGGLLGTEHILYGLTTVYTVSTATLIRYGVTKELASKIL
jgi:hypothetical protein